MITGWMFFFGCVLCLMFLGMLYGERFSLLGLFDGRWLAPVARVFGDTWTELCRGLDDVLEFVTEHSSWVIAAASGTVGLSIVAFLMFSGLANDAGAVHRDAATPLQQGGVLDSVPEIAARVTTNPIRLASAQSDESNVVVQQPGGMYAIFSPPRHREFDSMTPLLHDRQPVWDLSQTDLRLSLDRTRLHSPIEDLDETITVSRGRLIETPPVSLLRLRDDNWRMTGASISIARATMRQPIVSTRPALPESSAREASELESRVQVFAGSSVGSQDLRIEKAWPRTTTSGEVDIELTLLNVGDDIIHGIVVREILPWQSDVLDMNPDGVIRESIIVWLVEELPPFQEHFLRCTVRPPANSLAEAGGNFESRTEVSAATSVTSPITVVPRQQPPPIVTAPRIPEVTPRPEVRLEIEEPLTSVNTNDTVEVYFVVSNIGKAVAEDVQLRVTLDEGLDHHTLEDGDVYRRVENSIRRIEPGDSRRIVLRMRATRPGQHFATAEMIFNEAQLSLSTFQIVAIDPPEPVEDPPGSGL
jgi:hypothetical protein